MTSNRKAFLTVMMSAVLALSAFAVYVAAQSAEPKEKVIRISAKKFNYTPGEMQLKKGVPVILEFKTMDVVMGFNLPDFNVRADVVPDKVIRVRFVPDKTGTFTFLCDVFCGTKHEEMNGTITVVD